MERLFMHFTLFRRNNNFESNASSTVQDNDDNTVRYTFDAQTILFLIYHQIENKSREKRIAMNYHYIHFLAWY